MLEEESCHVCGVTFTEGTDDEAATTTPPSASAAPSGNNRYVGSNSNVYDSAADVVAADRVQAIREGTQATWYGESLPMALVYAPKTGKATLRAEASSDSKALGTLPDGTIVVVLDKNYRFTKVRVDGRTGYILNSALEALDETQLPLGEGMLIYPTTGGRGTTTINVRCEPSTNAARVDEWPTGTMVLVWELSENENWYEIEYDGLRGYVQAQYLNVTTVYDFTPIEDADPGESDEV